MLCIILYTILLLYRRDRWGRRNTEVVAMDAHVFHIYAQQFTQGMLKRELNKVRFSLSLYSHDRSDFHIFLLISVMHELIVSLFKLFHNFAIDR